MPLLEFVCEDCGEVFEAFQRLKEGIIGGLPCPKCGRTRTKVVEDPLDDDSCGIGPIFSQVK
ncbi:MAG: zinc ribbon domain-containing protein [Deltaproteobacteria bacterium]|nr:zinc ribbon domain-containing protein [Deltaproteobacteria bacterium]MBW2306700.1 zinc ribbon domain-containing protein [Deltaproteobacteria bacterium]